MTNIWKLRIQCELSYAEQNEILQDSFIGLSDNSIRVAAKF